MATQTDQDIKYLKVVTKLFNGHVTMGKIIYTVWSFNQPQLQMACVWTIMVPLLEADMMHTSIERATLMVEWRMLRY